jgi:hypothetical protein
MLGDISFGHAEPLCGARKASASRYFGKYFDRSQSVHFQLTVSKMRTIYSVSGPMSRKSESVKCIQYSDRPCQHSVGLGIPKEKELRMTSDTGMLLTGGTQLINQLFYFLDQSNYEELVALFEPDGIWHRQGEVLSGSAQIMQAMKKRPATQRIRHVVTNGFIDSQSEGLVHFVAYMMAYRFDDGSVRTGPVEISRPLRMSVIRAALRQTQGAWKVAEMSLTSEFEFVSNATTAGVQR